MSTLHYCCRAFVKAPGPDLQATATLQITLCGAGSDIHSVGQGLRYSVWGRSEIPLVGQGPCNGAGSEIPLVGQGPSCVLMLQHDSAMVAVMLQAAIGSAAFAMPDCHYNKRDLPVWYVGSCSTQYHTPSCILRVTTSTVQRALKVETSCHKQLQDYM